MLDKYFFQMVLLLTHLINQDKVAMVTLVSTFENNNDNNNYCFALYQAVAKMVQECYKYVDAVTDLTIKLRLIDTLRTVTAGKVCVCERELFVFTGPVVEF